MNRIYQRMLIIGALMFSCLPIAKAEQMELNLVWEVPEEGNRIQFTPDDKYLVVDDGLWYHIVRFYETETGKLYEELQGEGLTKFTADGKYMVTRTRNKELGKTYYNYTDTLIVRSYPDLKLIRSLEGVTGSEYAVSPDIYNTYEYAVSPDNKYVCVCYGIRDYYGVVTVYDFESGKKVRDLKIPIRRSYAPDPTNGEVYREVAVTGITSIEFNNAGTELLMKYVYTNDILIYDFVKDTAIVIHGGYGQRAVSYYPLDNTKMGNIFENSDTKTFIFRILDTKTLEVFQATDYNFFNPHNKPFDKALMYGFSKSAPYAVTRGGAWFCNV